MTENVNSPQAAAPVEGVVLLHGLGRTRLAMQALALRLARAGFRTACIGYPSRRLSLAQAVDRIAGTVARVTRGWDLLHLVGHSLGGVIAMSILAGRPDLVSGRVVILGSPMRGSALAAFFGRTAPARSFFGPVLADLARATGPLARRDRVGAIAGTGGTRGVARRVGLVGPNDGKVTARSAWAGAGHRAAVPVGHAMLPFSAEVARLTIHFLNHGRFPGAAERP